MRGGAFAVGDAKYWDRPLDVSLKGRGDPFTNKNPGFQISFYMQHAGTESGILTNGRLWRLYHKDTAHKLDRFYEVDLPELLATGDPKAFIYFYVFFHRSAFEDHPLGVRAMLEESVDYARSVGDSLKTQVYEALRHLAQGFLDYPQNGLEPDPDTLREIYDNSLILLYRLLFVLYAESRDLLPVRESEMYRDTYSLYAIKHEVAQGRPLLPTSATLWPKLRELFSIINRGSPPLSVGTFDGGLFDPERHPFIEQYTVGDGHLQEAVDKLSRVDGQFVDYRDLAERHLGTIYEGLLEYHLEALSEPEEGWTVALLNDKGERKATGSYYTPDYIAKYIVEETVGPVLRETVEDAGSDEEMIEAVLGLNVLDPSMGSGHFLVEATEHIARFLVELNVAPEEVEADGEAELAYWKRRVAQSCVYGVDSNPLAVDLAKLSLWLATVARNRPLSFLDHHFRCGNSLVGARISELQPASARKKAKSYNDAQLSMIGDPAFHNSMSTAVGNMWLIEENPADTVEEVKEQERIYEMLRENLTRRYARLADLATATYFGVEVDRTHWKALADYATGRITYAPPQFQNWIDEAQRISSERRFFHWELEFPEVFFDRQGRPLGDEAGFDAVDGNPPYISAWSMTNEDPILRTAIAALTEVEGILTGHWDLYVPFLLKAYNLCKEEGRFSFIVPNPFCREKYATNIREFLLKHTQIQRLLPFGEENVFDEVSRQTLVSVFAKAHPDRESAQVRIDDPLLLLRTTAPSNEALRTVPQAVFHQLAGYQIRYEISPEQVDVLHKVNRLSTYLGDICYVNYGAQISSKEKGKFGKSDLISFSPLGNAKKFFDGENISRYKIQWDGRYLDYRYEDMYGPRAPELFESPKIVVRDVTSADEGLIVSFDDSGLYCDHLLICATYYENVENTGLQTRFQGFRRLQSPYPSLLYLTSVLASRLLTWYFRQVHATGTLQGSYSHTYPQQIRAFPTRRIAFTMPENERERLRVKGQALYAQFCTKDDYACVLGFINHHLPKLPDGTPDTANESSDVVHDLLAYLAEQMIELNKQRQAAAEDFVLDLEGVLSAADLQKISRLWTPPSAPKLGTKTFEKKQAEYEESVAEAEQLLGPLATRRLELCEDIGRISEEQWKWLLKRRLKKIASLADLVRVYRSRQPTIAEFDERIANTDRLIDQIVYRLYGLNEEEIAIVEVDAHDSTD